MEKLGLNRVIRLLEIYYYGTTREGTFIKLNERSRRRLKDSLAESMKHKHARVAGETLKALHSRIWKLKDNIKSVTPQRTLVIQVV